MVGHNNKANWTQVPYKQENIYNSRTPRGGNGFHPQLLYPQLRNGRIHSRSSPPKSPFTPWDNGEEQSFQFRGETNQQSNYNIPVNNRFAPLGRDDYGYGRPQGGNHHGRGGGPRKQQQRGHHPLVHGNNEHHNQMGPGPRHMKTNIDITHQGDLGPRYMRTNTTLTHWEDLITTPPIRDQAQSFPYFQGSYHEQSQYFQGSYHGLSQQGQGYKEIRGQGEGPKGGGENKRKRE